MKKFLNLRAFAVTLLATAGAAHAALPDGTDTMAAEIITNIGLAAGLGATILVVSVATQTAFDLVKKFAKKGAK